MNSFCYDHQAEFCILDHRWRIFQNAFFVLAVYISSIIISYPMLSNAPMHSSQVASSPGRGSGWPTASMSNCGIVFLFQPVPTWSAILSISLEVWVGPHLLSKQTCVGHNLCRIWGYGLYEQTSTTPSCRKGWGPLKHCSHLQLGKARLWTEVLIILWLVGDREKLKYSDRNLI
jgi:hypothetical protein